MNCPNRPPRYLTYTRLQHDQVIEGGAVRVREVRLDTRKLDSVTLRYLEYLARVHIDAHAHLKTEEEAIAWSDHGEAICNAVDAFRKIVKPEDPIADTIRRGFRR